MKTLKIALVSTLIFLSVNSFAATSQPLDLKTLPEKNASTLAGDNLSYDSEIAALLQQMTASVRKLLLITPVAEKKSHSLWIHSHRSSNH